MTRNLSIVVLLAAAVLVAACGGKTPISPSDSLQNWDGIPPNPNAEHYISDDGLVEMYVKGIFPGRGGTIVPGQRAEVVMQVLYKGTREMVGFLPSVVDSPSDNPGRPGRNSKVFNSGQGFRPGDNRVVAFGTFSAPVAEDIPFVRFCRYNEDGRLDSCDVNMELNWHP